MLRTLALLAVLALAAQQAAAFYSEESEDRMIGGDEVTDVGSYSFQAAIRPVRGSIKLPVCSGIIIKGYNTTSRADAYWVLTSATCALSGNEYRIFIGTNRVSAATTPDMEASSSSVVYNPEFLTTFKTGDLALIPDQSSIIAKAISNASLSVSAAILPHFNDAGKGYLASSVRMSGWGHPNDVFNAAAPKLRSLSSRVVPNWYCSVVNMGKPISNKHLCTGGLINKGPCTGDSGAPLVASSDTTRVIGLATLTPSDGCSKGKPGVFTNLGYYLVWITEETNYDTEQ